MNLVPFQGLFPKSNLIADLDSFFGNAKYNFNKFQENGFFTKDPKEGFYLYEIKGEKHSHTGLVTGLDMDDLFDDRILPHEKTLASKEQEQLVLTLERKAMIKPILVGFNPFKAFQEFYKEKKKEKPDLSLELKKKKETHQFWKINSGSEIEFIIKLFKKKVKTVYIADGHHRCSISRILWYQSQKEMISIKMESLLSVLMPFDQLTIHDFNRVLELENYSPIKFVAELSNVCKIEALKGAKKPSKKGQLTMHLDGEWFMLTWRKAKLKKFKDRKNLLDYFLFNELVLKDILGIVDVREHPGIKYVPGPEKFKGIKKEMNHMDNPVGFMLHPLNMDDICYHADNEITLPPKSTYFIPRVVNGMIAKEIK